MELTQEQVQRLYLVFDFEESEEIIGATMEDEKGGWLAINYIDHKDETVACYRPYLARHSEEDQKKVKLILDGIKLTRDQI